MAKSNQAYPLKRFADAGVIVLDCDHRTPKPAPNGYPYIAIPNIRDGRLDLSEVRLMSEEDYESWTRRTNPQPGDIIVTRRARVGDTAIVPIGLKCAIGQNLVILRSDGKQIDQVFLRWILRSPQYWRQVRKFQNEGAVFSSLNVSDFPKFEVPVPPLPIQRRIADILGALDDKIECNRRINQTLEAMADTFFKHWFLDAGNDWESRPLDEVATFLNGLALQKYPPKDGASLPVIKIAELHRGTTESSDRASADIPSKYIVGDGDVLFSWSGSLEVCVWCDGRGALNQHLFKVTSAEYPKWFYYQWVKHHLPEFRAIAAGKATTMGHIQREHLHQALVVVPPSEDLQMMTIKVQPLLDQIIANNLESRTLTRTRDYLLPKLLSGEVALGHGVAVPQPVAESAIK